MVIDGELAFDNCRQNLLPNYCLQLTAHLFPAGRPQLKGSVRDAKRAECHLTKFPDENKGY